MTGWRNEGLNMKMMEKNKMKKRRDEEMKEWTRNEENNKTKKRRDEEMKKWRGDCVELVKRMNCKQNQSELKLTNW